MRVSIVGCPGTGGGANTECWHLIKMLRNEDIRVSVLPTSYLSSVWKDKIEATGAKILTGDQELDKVVVSLCNDRFLDMAPELYKRDHRTVWLNCMNWAFNKEREYVAKYGPFTRHVFQSSYQQSRLSSLLDLPDSSCLLLRGAFDLTECRFQYSSRHSITEDFRVGRLARADKDKWSSNTWKIYGMINHSSRKALLMGVSKEVAEKLGQTPDWAAILPVDAMPLEAFYRLLHCILPINGGAEENWPRIGLEAMAYGVPVVAQRSWGWTEMIREGVTGYLGDSDEELAHWVGVLAWDEAKRKAMAIAAREAVEVFAEEARVGWLNLLEELEA